MSYIVEEDEEIYEVNTINKSQIDCFWKSYSKHQQKRFKGVLRQMTDIWSSVQHYIHFLRVEARMSLEDSNFIMNKVHKMFLNENRMRINDNKERANNNKKSLSNKINKLRNSKQKI